MKTLILTDIMKTGHHWWYAQFLKYNTLRDQQIEICDEYYNLNKFKLIEFDRKIAMICSINDHLLKNTEYKTDLSTRIKKLTEKGFKFIIANPWESLETSTGNKHMSLFSSISIGTWYGNHNWFWFYMYEKHHNKNFVFDHSIKKYNFLYLNKQKREHRINLYNELFSNGMLGESLYSFLGLDKPVKLAPSYELPWVDTSNYPWTGRDQDIYEKPYNESCCSIVSESANNEIFLTEKIWKPIIAEQLFVVHGGAGYLKKLKEMGFKTFAGIIDESYDDETDSNKRLKKIVGTLKTVRSYCHEELYNKTVDIRKHNKNIFFNRNQLSNSINQTMLNFFNSYDK